MDRRLLLLAPLIALLAAVCWFVLLPRFNSARPPSGDAAGPAAGRGDGTATPTTPQLEAFRRLALNACRCARRLPPGNGGREACWSEFNREISGFSHTVGGTMCAPMSTEEVCFESGCVVQTYGEGACSEDEARVIQAIADEDFTRNPDRYARRLDRAVQAFVRGERVEAPRSARGGCPG